jgi:hypothetical protein
MTPATLVAADRGERCVWAHHLALLAFAEVPSVSAPVVAKARRGGDRQALLARLFAGALDDCQAGAQLARHDLQQPATS